MNIYISVPMSGRTLKEVEKDIRTTKKDFGFHSRKNHYITNLEEFKAGEDPLIGLGRAIEKIAGVDAILVCPGWRNSKGCRIEVATAVTYGIPIYGIDAQEADDFEVVIRKKYKRVKK